MHWPHTLLSGALSRNRVHGDADDIRVLAERLGLGSSKQALDVVLGYYPEDRLPVRTRLLLEELLDDGR